MCKITIFLPYGKCDQTLLNIEIMLDCAWRVPVTLLQPGKSCPCPANFGGPDRRVATVADQRATLRDWGDCDALPVEAKT